MLHKSDAAKNFSPQDGKRLLKLARITLKEALNQSISTRQQKEKITAQKEAIFQQACGTFVTLKHGDRLRGCIGTLSASLPIAQSIPQNAINAAFHDPRFDPLKQKELDQIRIEISILTTPRPLTYTDHEELLTVIRPTIDGVILSFENASATFLPQVWEQLQRVEDFLSHLCLKAGLPGDTWQLSHPDISVYQVQYFEE
jgi:AmmeMemoRadiSam system protein A